MVCMDAISSSHAACWPAGSTTSLPPMILGLCSLSIQLLFSLSLTHLNRNNCGSVLTHHHEQDLSIIISGVWCVYIVECDLNVHIGECNLNVMHETCSAACGSVGGEGPCRKVLVKNNRTDWLFLVVFTVPTLSVHIAFHFKLDNKEKSNHRFFK